MYTTMTSYTLEPLHSRQDLIEDTVRLLKEEWPMCLAERLQVVETPKCTGLPCSLVLIETREGAKSEVLGHVRIVQVHPQCEQRVYIESVAIKRSRRNQGLGRKLHELIEDYAKNCLGSRYLHVSVRSESNEEYYRCLGFEECKQVTVIAPNVLRTFPYARWSCQIIPDEWKFLYEGGEIVTKEEEDKEWIHRYVKDLYKA
ncbi:N-alpha-acetyltransferase 80-like isoform X2 [Patiria miniata]|uniref:N-acetyltransferase domain-containing protein n=1 Tax=Patiria miniata TaxID=46514 RepID=A0A914BCX8_PATMI|nr:N-alpha-acetyltransferase 80-like isoform X2 [Patiria miniata]